MTDSPAQWLHFLPGMYKVEHLAGQNVLDEVDWLALVRAPEGLTVIRRVPAGADDAWAALYGGGTAHDLDVPGMLSALLLPLKQAGLPVFVASTYHADIVLVPGARREEAVAALRAAGHRVDADG